MEKIKNKKLNSLYSITLTAMMSAVIAVGAYITVPYTVPFTMQTFAVFLSAKILGGKKATLSVLIYILAGAIGLPVFSGFRGGLGVITGPTGGYITGFLFITLLFMIFEKYHTKRVFEYITAVSGLIICYIFGTAQFTAVSASSGGSQTFIGALAVCVLPYILPDLIKLALAISLGEKIKKNIK